MSAELYTKDSCPHCVRAKKLLEVHNIATVEIDAVANREMLIDRVTKASGMAPRTVPQIFLEGRYIGGADDLDRYLRAR